MLNTRSDHLVVLLTTYDRLDALKRALNSIRSRTYCSYEVVVIDGGSTDGTIEYLQSCPDVTPVFQGQLLGTARAHNEVWRRIRAKYTCWLSDDTEIVDGALDLAIRILDKHTEIGMVGLKMKDTIGPWATEPYMGGISDYGILNCNHGVLRMDLLKSVSYFNEYYYSYMIDPDLTGSVLSAGMTVVMTKQVCVLHHREWSVSENEEDKIRRRNWLLEGRGIYREKFKYLSESRIPMARVTDYVGRGWRRILFANGDSDAKRLGLNFRDWRNLTQGRFIALNDPLKNLQYPYHLVQRIPTRLLVSEANPYRNLLNPSNIDPPSL